MSLKDQVFVSSAICTTGNTQVVAVGTPCLVTAISMNPASSVASEVILHNGAQTDTILWNIKSDGTQTWANGQSFGEPGVMFSNGLNLEVTGAGVTGSVAYHTW